MESILDLNNISARDYLLQSSSYCTINLPSYIDFTNVLDFVKNKVGNKDWQSCLMDSSRKPSSYEGVNYQILLNKDGGYSYRRMQLANPFKGLTKEASFVPPKNVMVGEGRANPKYVKYLYVAESPTTAMYEVRPFIWDAVNIAKIRVNEPLKIADIAVELDLSQNNEATTAMWVMKMIQNAFSKPTNNTDDYLPTQVIAEYMKSLGYDGIRFSSSLHYGGVNLTIFNYEKCEAVSSLDFRVEGMKITARAAFGSANYRGDLSYIKDNEPKYLN